MDRGSAGNIIHETSHIPRVFKSTKCELNDGRNFREFDDQFMYILMFFWIFAGKNIKIDYPDFQQVLEVWGFEKRTEPFLN